MGLLDKMQQQPKKDGVTGEQAAAAQAAIARAQAELPVPIQRGAPPADSDPMYSLVMAGDISKFSPQQKMAYVKKLCEDLRLNWMTKPFDFIKADGGRYILYATKECATQLALRDKVSVEMKEVRFDKEGAYLEVWVRATTPDGRVTDEIGALAFSDKLKGEPAAIQRMKCVTKAKRRAILSHCGLGLPDETEIESIPGARRVDHDEVVAVIPETPAAPPPPPAPKKKETPKNEAPVVEAKVEAPAAPPAAAPASAPVPASDAASSAPAAGDSDPDVFRWEDKPCRQRLIEEFKSRFPKIDRSTLVQMSDAYKHAASWKVVLRNLDDILAFERAKGDSKLL